MDFENKIGKSPKCIIRQEWLSRIDVLGHQIGLWGKKIEPTVLFCEICMCCIHCATKGYQAISQHVNSSKHRQNADTKLNINQLQLGLVPREVLKTSQLQETNIQVTFGNSSSFCVSDASIQPSTVWSLCTSQEKGIVAELLWVVKCVSSNFSSLSCDGIENLFRAMFSVGVPTTFSLSKKKVGYLQTECLGPYFYRLLSEDAQTGSFVVCYDETTNSESVKELQVSIRFWSEMLNEVVFCHLQTFFLGHATAVILKDCILNALKNSNLSLCKMLMLSCDGPNVNKSVMRQINETVKKENTNGTGLIDIGTCNLHIIHNSFKKGLDTFGYNVSSFLINVHNWFDDWPSRLEDYREIQKKLNIPAYNLLKHVSSRWLSLHAPGKRALEQWPALCEYFLKFVPKKVSLSQLSQMKKYSEIKNCLKRDTMRAEIAFVIDTADIFERYSRIFQKEEPMIHILYSEMRSLVDTLAARFCKKEALDQIYNSSNPFIPENLLLVKDIRCGDLTEKELAFQYIKEVDGLKFRKSAQDHYKATILHLLKKSILNSPTAKYFRCLLLSEIEKSKSFLSAEKMIKMLPSHQISTSTFLDEWKILERENLPAWDGSRIDHYWRQIFKLKNNFNEPKYPNIQIVVKAVLSLSHGSSDVERSFSVSARILTDDKTRMSEKTLNAKLNIKTGLKYFYGKPEMVPMTKELLISARFAHSKYKKYLEEKKISEEERKRKQKEDKEEAQRRSEFLKAQNKTRQDIEELEKKIKEAKHVENQEKAASDSLFEEAKERLKRALNNKDLQGAKIVYGMLEGAVSIKDQQKLSEVESLQKTLNQKKSSLITSFLKTKMKDTKETESNDNSDDTVPLKKM